MSLLIPIRFCFEELDYSLYLFLFVMADNFQSHFQESIHREPFIPDSDLCEDRAKYQFDLLDWEFLQVHILQW